LLGRLSTDINKYLCSCAGDESTLPGSIVSSWRPAWSRSPPRTQSRCQRWCRWPGKARPPSPRAAGAAPLGLGTRTLSKCNLGIRCRFGGLRTPSTFPGIDAAQKYNLCQPLGQHLRAPDIPYGSAPLGSVLKQAQAILRVSSRDMAASCEPIQAGSRMHPPARGTHGEKFAYTQRHHLRRTCYPVALLIRAPGLGSGKQGTLLSSQGRLRCCLAEVPIPSPAYGAWVIVALGCGQCSFTAC
jgi:hypothetical protein